MNDERRFARMRLTFRAARAFFYRDQEVVCVFPTALGPEMSKGRVADLRAASGASDRGRGGRRRTWRTAVGVMLVAIGERLREDEASYAADRHLVRLP